MVTTAQLSENSHQGFEGIKATLCLASIDANSNPASGMQPCLRQNRIGSRCSGKERDPESGLDYFGARYYYSGLGRWLSADAVTQKQYDPQSLNKYAYVRNDPINLVDRDGHWYECAERNAEGDCVLWYFDPEPHEPMFYISPRPATKAELIAAGAYAPLKRPCTEQKKGFFENLNVYKDMANNLETDVNFIMALSVQESGWRGQHAQDLHNLFGLTEGGGNNLNFKSYQESADYWVSHFGSAVKGKNTLSEFLDALQAMGYNSADQDWRTKIAGGILTQGSDKGKKTEGTYESVLNARESCNIQ